MGLRFAPNAEAVGSIDFRPFMIEVAWDYCKTLLETTHQRGMIEQTIGALATEIVLKSFNASVTGNAGELNETYGFNRAVLPPKSDPHSLKVLAHAIRPDVRAYLLDTADEEIIEEHAFTFKMSRYHYERSAPIWSSGEVMKLAVNLVCKTVYLYRQRGCADPFILGFDMDAVYLKHVQQFFTTRQGEA